MNRCFLWFHKWSNWKDQESVKLTKTTFYGTLLGSETEIVGMMMVQVRYCERCNKVQLNNIKTK